MHKERVTAATTDGVILVGDWYTPDAPNGWCTLLLHMMPADRSSWSVFADMLVQKGWSVLAIDLRGHGESTQSVNGTMDYHTFTPAEHRASEADVETSLTWLREHNFSQSNIVLVGASIGANLAFQTLARHGDIPTAVLLSSGDDYHGILTTADADKIQPAQALLLVASDEDQLSAESVPRLHNTLRCHKYMMMLSGAGHGTTMFARAPQLLDDVTGWMEDIQARGGDMS